MCAYNTICMYMYVYAAKLKHMLGSCPKLSNDKTGDHTQVPDLYTDPGKCAIRTRTTETTLLCHVLQVAGG